MSQRLGVPCPSCGGLVGLNFRCQKCGTTWSGIFDFLNCSLVHTSERMVTICESVGPTIEFWDTFSLHKRYENELERVEKLHDRHK